MPSEQGETHESRPHTAWHMGRDTTSPYLHNYVVTKACWLLDVVPAFHAAHAVFHVPQTHG